MHCADVVLIGRSIRAYVLLPRPAVWPLKRSGLGWGG